MLRHKEPIFSRSTGTWPPETGPVAHKANNARAAAPAPARGRWWEPHSPSEQQQNGRGSAVSPAPPLSSHHAGAQRQLLVPPLPAPAISEPPDPGLVAIASFVGTAPPPAPRSCWDEPAPSPSPSCSPLQPPPPAPPAPLLGGLRPMSSATISPRSLQRTAPFYRSALSQGHRCCSAAANEVIPDHATEFAMERGGKGGLTLVLPGTS